METDPLSIILVKGDSKGDRLLFRYPFTETKISENGSVQRRKNPYSVLVNEDLLEAGPPKKINIENGRLVGLTDEVLSNLFAVKQELWEKKFEVKTNDVRFVGHPTIIRQSYKKGEISLLVNIVFALRATASHSIVTCYHELSKRLGLALIHEEIRCGYFTDEMKLMIVAHDEYTRGYEEGVEGLKSPFDVILEQCSLARDLKRSYDDLCSLGLVQFRLNRTKELSFCLPQKVHQLHNSGLRIEPEAIDRCLEGVRPYHGLLLLVEARQLLKSLSRDPSSHLGRLVKHYSPLKSFSSLSHLSGLTFSEVMKNVGHLVYWGKAMVVYPLCESNVYTLAPNCAVTLSSPLVEKFHDKFPNHSLIQVMSDYSLPLSLREKLSPVSEHQDTEIQMVIWLLQHRLLIQLHTYVYYMPNSQGLFYLGLQEGEVTEEKRGPSGLEGVREEGGEAEGEAGDEGETALEDHHHQPGEGGHSSEEEEQPSPHWLSSNRLPLGASPADLTLLNTLITKDYFDGRTHVEEIMYQEKMKRCEVVQLLDKFRDVVVTSQTEDPNLSLFYPHHYQT